MAEIHSRPDANQPSEQPGQQEPFPASSPNTQSAKRGLFRILAGLLPQRELKVRVAPPPKPLRVELRPDGGAFAPMNRIVELPMEHQMSALELLYRETYAKGRGPGWEQTDAPFRESRQRIFADVFACAVEPDPELQSVADVIRQKQAEAYLIPMRQHLLSPQDIEPYQGLDATMFSPQVAQSREICLKMLQDLSPCSGDLLRGQLRQFDQTSNFESKYDPPRPGIS